MGLFNQIIFAVFSLILLGIFASTVRKQSAGEFEFFNLYWPATLLLRATCFAAWALVPLFNKTALTVANISLFASAITVALFIRAWRKPVTDFQRKVLASVLIVVTCIFIYLLNKDNGYSSRIILMGSLVTLMTLWKGYEIWRVSKYIHSMILKMIFTLIVIQTIVGVIGLSFLDTTPQNQAPSILEANNFARVFLFLTFGLQIITYVLINSFLYERLWVKEKLTSSDLKTKQFELATTTKEKDEISLLLQEKEMLIASLLKANKTAATGALSAAIAHELNQPLGASLINVQFLKMLANSQNLDLTKQKDVIEALESDTKRASTIIKVLRSFFLEEAIESIRINATEVLLNVIQIIEPELKTKKIKLNFHAGKDIELKMNRTEFQQLILNILNNAIEALSTIDQEIKTITIETKQTIQYTEISISDNGPGIPETLREGMFELLSGNKKSGMGLGLWLCNHIMERHGGKIYAEQSMEKGAMLVMRFN